MLPNLFYIISFSISIFASCVNLSFGLTMILIVVIRRQSRTVTNILMCNTAVASTLYSVYQILVSSYGIREDWFHNQPACVFRAYLYAGLCMVVCVSYTVQSISRLFFAVLYRRTYLLSWRTHWLMIFVNYLLAILGPIPPIFMSNAYVLELESRLCLPSTKLFYSSMYIVTVVFLIPVLIIIIIYGIIFHRARQSTRRVVAFASDSTGKTASNNSIVPNLKREMTLMKNILILVTILMCAGVPYLILVLWHVTQKASPPEPFYLLVMIIVSVFSAVKMVTLFCMNKDAKDTAVKYLRVLRQF